MGVDYPVDYLVKRYDCKYNRVFCYIISAE